MRSNEITLGRSFAVMFDHGDDFFEALTDFCIQNSVRQGYIPSFIAGFSEVNIVGTCDKLDDPHAPVWSKVRLTNVEAFGGGTLAYDDQNDRVAPHIPRRSRTEGIQCDRPPVIYSAPQCNSSPSCLSSRSLHRQ